MRIALGIEYDGAPYCGWQSQSQSQNNMRGVQNVLEASIHEVSGQDERIHAAGRTDTGVHALSQVVHFDTEVNRPISAWIRGVNAFLPASIRVQWAKAVSDEFHARFSAQQRRYQYLLVNTPVAPAINASKAGWYHSPLDMSTMQAAIVYLQGEHDFSAFRASECQAKSPIKNLQIASIMQHGDYFIFEFAANAFLHHMVRNMVGALIYVGKGKNPPDFMQELLTKKDRKLSPPTFSPNGLYLAGVQYDAKFDLPNTQRGLNFI